MEITTPAILFSTISLLLLAFTNRYLAMANLVRGLHRKFKEEGPKEPRLIPQIKLILFRLELIRNMQIISILSLLISAVSMFLFFLNQKSMAEFAFGASIVLLIAALVLSVWEITKSNQAINIELSDLDEFLNE